MKYNNDIFYTHLDSSLRWKDGHAERAIPDRTGIQSLFRPLFILAALACATPLHATSNDLAIEHIKNLQTRSFKGFADTFVHRHTTPTKIWSGLLTIGCGIAAWHGAKKWMKNKQKIDFLKKYIQEHLPKNQKYFHRALNAAMLTTAAGIFGFLSLVVFVYAFGTDAWYCHAMSEENVHTLISELSETIQKNKTDQMPNEVSFFITQTYARKVVNVVALLKNLKEYDHRITNTEREHQSRKFLGDLLYKVSLTDTELIDMLREKNFKAHDGVLKYFWGRHPLTLQNIWCCTYSPASSEE